MNLYEYQSKIIFYKNNILIPKGYICRNSNEIENAINKLNKDNWILKCQSLITGRKKYGLIKIFNNILKSIIFSNKFFKKNNFDIKDNFYKNINCILVEEVIKIYKELYLSLFVDYENYCISCIVSIKGGSDIDLSSKKYFNLIHKTSINPLIGLKTKQVKNLFFKLNLNEKYFYSFNKILNKIYNIFIKKDFLFLEINPLAITNNNNFICLDIKSSIDDNSIFKHKDLFKYINGNSDFFYKKNNLNYIKMDGNIGCISNGAGLSMSIIDMIYLYGGSAANFFDIGGMADKITFNIVINKILNNKNVKVILINIFGGIVDCELIANYIIEYLLENKIIFPIIVRFEGNNSLLGIKKIIKSNLKIKIEYNLIDSIKKAILISKD